MSKVTQLTQEEMDAVMYDARAGDLETLKEIFEEIGGQTLLSIKDDITLSTPLHFACANGHFEVVEYLLSIISTTDAEQYVNQKNDTGNTALHWAAYNGHLPVVELLCDKFNADPFVKNELGHDPIYEADNNDQVEIEKWFLNKYTPEDQIDVEEQGENTKITYTPGTESKEADDRAAQAKAGTPESAKEQQQPSQQAGSTAKLAIEKLESTTKKLESATESLSLN
jgi:ankyrin repeat protein